MEGEKYIHELPSWSAFTWDAASLGARLAEIRHRQGRLIGHMEALGFPLRQEAVLQTLTSDVIKSSEIEGEKLNLEQVRSSLARRMGIPIGALSPADRNVEGVVEMMLDATGNYAAPLTAKRLFGWHSSLFPGGWSGFSKIEVGAWRTDSSGPMEVVSGAIGRERVHFRAPAASRLDADIRRFLTWFNTPPQGDPVWKAGLAHLWFVTIHPFEDGNGRIARAIADMALARAEDSSQRFYSMSAQIRVEREAYYRTLENTQKGSMDVTPWMDWFVECLGRAILEAQNTLSAVLTKGRFWESMAGTSMNERQRKVLGRMLDGSEGRLTTSKYAKLAGCSEDTALRDIVALVALGALTKGSERGRSTGYLLPVV